MVLQFGVTMRCMNGKQVVGRFTKLLPKGKIPFFPEYITQVKKLCLLGSTNEQLADFFNISVETLYEWKLRHKAFDDAIRNSKRELDNRVVESLFHRAMGYSHPEDKIFCKDGEVTTVKTEKHYAPDTNAIIFWLKNRQSKTWSDKIQTDLINSDGSLRGVNIDQMSVKVQYILERARQLKELKAKAITVEPEDDSINDFI